MIIVVSDIHLGYQKSNSESFRAFLEQCRSIDLERFIILGDLLDFWRCNNAQVVADNQHILELIGRLNAKTIHYIPGNHDFYIHKLAGIYGSSYPFVVSKWLTLDDGGSRINFRHGYELEVLANLEPMTIETYEWLSERMCFTERVTGGILSQLWDLIEDRRQLSMKVGFIRKPPHERNELDKVHELAVSKGVYLLLGMRPGEKLIFGHTHKPFINEEKTIANSGSWVDEGPADRPRNTYIVIDGGRMELRHFGTDPFP
jgi:UDP-2,3-diacylglucosamine pyrophosphatase LpxH